MRDGLPEGAEWDVLARHLVLSSSSAATRIPFKTFGASLTRDISAAQLHATYLRLLRSATNALLSSATHLSQSGQPNAAEEILRGRSKEDDVQESTHGMHATQTGSASEEAKISYNMALTLDAMVIMPRATEGAAVHDADGKEAGWLALNGTVLAGTTLVKNESEWDALRGDEGQLLDVLGKIGLRQDEA
jgi:sulfate adenylyltransferase (ADP) / ATP adenylyltransferase